MYEPALHASVLQRLALKADLEFAVERGELQVHYQPTVALDSGRITGLEALLRWHHPTCGFVSPAEFIPLAEETGAINDLGRWVLEQACQEVRRWQDAYPSDPPLAINVNLSARQLQRAEIVDEVAETLRMADVSPQALVLEITESAVLRETPEVLDRLVALRRLGVALAIDDFGAGYSSFAYLRQLPVDYLKIDKSFIDDLARGSQGVALASAIIELGHMLGL